MKVAEEVEVDSGKQGPLLGVLTGEPTLASASRLLPLHLLGSPAQTVGSSSGTLCSNQKC